jgi:hypothetical protein
MQVHPVAALFPMLPDDELDDLAEDIRANGLLHPIVLDADGVLIDGRNRLEACRRAGVEPRFERLNGREPIAFVLSANVARRHLTLGQRAMATVCARVETGFQLPYGWATDAAGSLAGPGTPGSKRMALSHAYTVVLHAPDLVPKVLAGASLADAYAEALRRKRVPEQQEQRRLAFEDEEDRRAAAEERLRASIQLAVEEIGPEVPIPQAPDLSIRVTEEQRPATGKPAEAADLRAQQVYLNRLIAVRNELADLRDAPVVAGAWWPEGHAAAVRSAVSQIVADAYAIVEANNARGDQRIRKVK